MAVSHFKVRDIVPSLRARQRRPLLARQAATKKSSLLDAPMLVIDIGIAPTPERATLSHMSSLSPPAVAQIFTQRYFRTFNRRSRIRTHCSDLDAIASDIGDRHRHSNCGEVRI
jgi:hypothetical protein